MASFGSKAGVGTSVATTELEDGAVTNAKVSDTADIAGSKLQEFVKDTNAGVIPSAGIVNAHVDEAAAIAGSKLQALVVSTNAGVIPSTGVADAHVSSSAAIAVSKLANVVNDNAAQTIAGVKTFSSDPLIPDEAYGAGWNGVLEP